MGTLKVLPCLDSEERGLALKRILDIPGWRAAELGRTALEAARNGFYLTPEGRKVAWGNLVQAAIAAKISIPPEAELPSAPHPSFPQTEVQVANETTLEAGLRLSRRGLVPLALNFANGIHPGGGFLSGARAQVSRSVSFFRFWSVSTFRFLTIIQSLPLPHGAVLSCGRSRL